MNTQMKTKQELTTPRLIDKDYLAKKGVENFRKNPENPSGVTSKEELETPQLIDKDYLIKRNVENFMSGKNAFESIEKLAEDKDNKEVFDVLKYVTCED